MQHIEIFVNQRNETFHIHIDPPRPSSIRSHFFSTRVLILSSSSFLLHALLIGKYILNSISGGRSAAARNMISLHSSVTITLWPRDKAVLAMEIALGGPLISVGGAWFTQQGDSDRMTTYEFGARVVKVMATS